MNRRSAFKSIQILLVSTWLLASLAQAQYVRQSRFDTRAQMPNRLPKDAYGFVYHRQETDYSCGVAAFMPVGRFWGVYSGAEKDLYRLFEVDPEVGTPELAIVKGAKHFGLEAFLRDHVPIATLRTALAEGYTPILEIQAWPEGGAKPGFDWENDWDDGHYVALMAIDDHYAYFMDSAVEEHGSYAVMSLKDLDRRWHNWAELEHGKEIKAQHVAVFIRGKKRFPIALDPRTKVIPLE